MGLPLMAVDVLRQHAVGVELGQQLLALVLRQANDAGGEPLADEQRLAAVFRVGTHDRVDDFGDLGELLRGQGRAPVAFEFGLAVTRGVGVRGRATFNGIAQREWQVVPGFVHVGEQCVTAF
ncbi:hypothetical protein D3C86_1358820 [compost metagenome]